MIRVVIVDDHSVVREGLRLFLQRDVELEVVGEAADGAEAVEKVRQLRPHVVVMDLYLPGMDGFEATSIIHREMPETKVVVLTGELANGSVLRLLRAGAIGYMYKDMNGPDMCSTIKLAAAGQLLLSRQVSMQLIEETRGAGLDEQLTAREREVLQQLAEGDSNKDIARSLCVAEDTIKTHIRHILEKLGVESRSQAIVAAIRLGLVAMKQPD